MHYLTNYYKNLSEQLQEKVNILEKALLIEKGGPSPQPKPDLGYPALKPRKTYPGPIPSRNGFTVPGPKPEQQGGDLVWVKEVPDSANKDTSYDDVERIRSGSGYGGNSKSSNEPTATSNSNTPNTSQNEPDRYKNWKYDPEFAAMIRLAGMIPNPGKANLFSDYDSVGYTKDGKEYNRGYSAHNLINIPLLPDQKRLYNMFNRIEDKYRRQKVNPQTGEVTRTSDMNKPPSMVNGEYRYEAGLDGSLD